MIHEILPNLFNNQYQSGIEPGNNDYIFHFDNDQLLLKKSDEQLFVPKITDIEQLPKSSEPLYLFTYNHVNCFLTWDRPVTDQNSFIYREIYHLRLIHPKELAWIGSVAYHIKTWYEQNRFCGQCGTKTTHHSTERALKCPNCGFTAYPKISPAIIVAIVDGDHILLARGVNFRAYFYSLIAGYADVGESLEETVIREVKEEVGIDVKNIRYYKSQPWPFSGSMMIGFIAEANKNQALTIDHHEILEAAWFSKDKLPEFPPSISIAGEMIEKFKSGLL